MYVCYVGYACMCASQGMVCNAMHVRMVRLYVCRYVYYVCDVMYVGCVCICCMYVSCVIYAMYVLDVL